MVWIYAINTLATFHNNAAPDGGVVEFVAATVVTQRFDAKAMLCLAWLLLQRNFHILHLGDQHVYFGPTKNPSHLTKTSPSKQNHHIDIKLNAGKSHDGAVGL